MIPRWAIVLAVIGFGMFLWKDPTGAADMVGGFFDTVGEAFDKAITFLSALFS